MGEEKERAAAAPQVMAACGGGLYRKVMNKRFLRFDIAFSREVCSIIPRAMSMKPALRDLHLCLQCCMARSKSLLPQGGGRHRRRRIGASLEKRFLRLTGPSGRRVLRFDSGFAAEGCGIALSGDEYEVSVTGLPSRRTLRAFCIECASRPKLALSLHTKGPSFYLADRPF